MLRNLIVSLFTLFQITNSQLVGGQRDSHECVLDGGYQWCQTLNQCVRPWMTPCPPVERHPVDPILKKETTIPRACVSWFDGCNNCMVNNGKLGDCTKMYCFTNQDDPHCMSYSKGDTPLKVGEVCSRFCEDNSELSVSKANLCPKGTLCQSTTPSMISFDTCNSRAYRCVIQNH